MNQILVTGLSHLRTHSSTNNIASEQGEVNFYEIYKNIIVENIEDKT